MSGAPNRGGAVAGCPKNKANIWTCVTQMGTAQPVSGVRVEIRGPTPGVAMSGPDGYVRFSGVNPGDYTLVVTGQGGHQEVSPYDQAVGVGKGQTQMKNVEVFSVGDLRVEVYDDQVPPRPVPYARISADGVSSQQQPRANSHLHPFLRIPAGVYRVGAEPTTPDHGSAGGTVQGTVPAGGSVTVRVVLPAVNVVTPRIAHTALGAPRKADELLFLPGPRRQAHVDACALLNPVPPAAAADDLMALRLSLTETLPGKPFTGHGALTWVEQGLAVFSDAAGTVALASGVQFSKAQLAGGHTVYVRGLAAGAKHLMLTLGGAAAPGITLMGPAMQTVQATEVGLVKPVIAVEHQVVVRDRDDLRGHELTDPGRALKAKPTWVDLSIVQEGGAIRYAGNARLTGSGRAAMFSDEACTTAFDASQPIPVARLTGGTPLRIWLSGRHRGTFKLALALDDPADVRLVHVPKVEKDMVTVRPELKLYRHDRATMPTVAGRQGPLATYHANLLAADLSTALKALTDKEKIDEGRLLHLQNDYGYHGRAKLVIEALAPGHWPAYTDTTELVLSVLGEGDAAPKGPELKLFDAEVNGNEIALPARWTVAALKAADMTLWVQASGRSKAWRDLALNVSVEQGDYKRPHAEWARFTAVQIKEVALKAKVTGRNPEVRYEKKKRWYVNVDNQARNLRDHATHNREVKVTAQIEPKLQGVKLHFMLACRGEHRGNNAANRLPGWDWGNLDAAVKETDRPAPDALLHVHADTDADGLARTNDLVLPRFGGDKVRIGAYITDDAHLAKYVPGHAQLGLRKPVMTKEDEEFEIWRRIFVQLTAARFTIVPSRSLHYNEFKRNYLKVTEVTERRYSKSSIANAQEHPKWQFEPGAGTSKVICVGTHNRAAFRALFTAATAEHTPKGHLILIDQQWDPATSLLMVADSPSREATIRFRDTTDTEDVGIFDPPLGNGTPMMQPQANIWRWTDGAGQLHDGWLTPAHVKIRKSRGSYADAVITVPSTCGADCACGAGGVAINPSGASQVHVEVALACGKGPYAGESGSPGAPHCLIVLDKNAARFNNTIAHELGHMFTMVRSGAAGAQRAAYFGAPQHPNWYEKHGGVGAHCSTGATPSADPNNVDEDGNAVFEGGSCVMYHVAAGNTTFCGLCSTDLRVQNLEDFFQ